MLRTTVIGIVACMLTVTLAIVALSATGLLPAFRGFGLWLALQLGILYLALRFERVRYKAIETGAPPGFEATAERFDDPATGVTVQVWFNPATGERRYVRCNRRTGLPETVPDTFGDNHMVRHFLLAAAALTAAPVLAQSTPVTVVELFQSQGCSSCPPANANVNALIASRPDVLALSFAVTYWDNLGWKDRFATPAYTQRQWDYAHGLNHDQVWTPQVIVNGRADTTGTRPGQIDKVIATTAKVAGPAIDIAAGSVTVGKAPSAKPADVWLVRYDPRVVEVSVKAGENSGRTLPHRNIVRELTRLGDWNGASRVYQIPPAGAGLATAVLVQSRQGGPILAAARG